MSAAAGRRIEAAPLPIKTLLYLILLTSCAALGGGLFGLDIGLVGSIINMQDFQVRYEGDPWTLGFISAGMNIGALTIVLWTPLVGRWLGRRDLIAAAGAVFVVMAVLQGFAWDFWSMMFGRVISGGAIAVCATAVPVYLAELAPTALRGALVSLQQAAINFTICFIYWFAFAIRGNAGPYDWRICFFVSSIPALLLAATVCCFPRSPRWLLLRGGKEDEAWSALTRMRRSDGDEVRFEFNDLLDQVSAEKRATAAMRRQRANVGECGKRQRGLALSTAPEAATLVSGSSGDGGKGAAAGGIGASAAAGGSTAADADSIDADIDAPSRSGAVGCVARGLRSARSETGQCTSAYAELFRGAVLLPTCLAFAVQLLQQIQGINVIMYFGPRVVDGFGLPGNLYTGVVQTFNFGFTFAGVLTVDRLGRKPLLLAGSTIMLVAMLLIGVIGVIDGHFVEDAMNESGGAWVLKTQGLGYVCCACFVLYLAAFSATWGPVGWLVPSELFPTQHRAKGMIVASMANWGSNALLGVLFPYVNAAIGFYCYFVFSCLCVVSIIFVAVALPETKGLKLEEVQERLSQRSFRHCCGNRPNGGRSALDGNAGPVLVVGSDDAHGGTDE
tara:strand:+ start:190 stop:2037 length:1848 start_codon:yes stop_codon:yes gene_type:complete